MKSDQLLRAILLAVLIANFDVDRFEKNSDRFDIWLDGKKVQLPEDKNHRNIISNGFDDYHTIQDYPPVVVPLIFMYASANDLKRGQARCSAMSGIYSFNAKIKAFRTQFRGVGDIKFFMFRLATLYS